VTQPASRVKEAHTAFDSWYVTDKPKLGMRKTAEIPESLNTSLSVF